MSEKRPTSRRSGRPRRRRDEPYEGYYERQQPRQYAYDEYEYEQPQPPPRRRSHPRSRRKRSVWPALLTGCALGIVITVVAAAVVVFLTLRTSQGVTPVPVPGINNVHSFTHDDSIPVPLSTPLTQLQVCDKIGNISIHVDTNAQAAMIATHKIVHTDNSTDANQEFGRIKVEAQPPGTISQSLTCTQPAAQSSATGNSNSVMIVNATMPDSQSFVHGSSDAVDLSITLPQAMLPTDPVLGLNAETAVGNITVDGLSGALSIKDSSGNIQVNHAILADRSRIETGQGNVIFNGLLAKSNDPQVRYTLQSEQGKIDVTLPGDTNVILDANTNVGKITSEFGTNIQSNNNGQANYHGPLNSSAGTSSGGTLILDVSTGDVNIHKTT